MIIAEAEPGAPDSETRCHQTPAAPAPRQAHVALLTWPRHVVLGAQKVSMCLPRSEAVAVYPVPTLKTSKLEAEEAPIFLLQSFQNASSKGPSSLLVYQTLGNSGSSSPTHTNLLCLLSTKPALNSHPLPYNPSVHPVLRSAHAPWIQPSYCPPAWALDKNPLCFV